MKLSQFKEALNQAEKLEFCLPNGTNIPAHFHITEAGLTTKHFIDCGGTVRTEKTVSFQIWTANDVEHRLKAPKLLNIIRIAEPLLGEEDLDVEMEYQAETIGRYGLAFDGQQFIFTPKFTNCLAQDQCGIPQEKRKLNLSELTINQAPACTPGGGCC
jgi:hypothetical protein